MRFVKTFFFIPLLICSLHLGAQQVPEGFFTSESAAVVMGDDIIISIKKYNPTAEEITNAIKPPKNAPMNYLQVPAEATNMSLYDKSFESVIYCLNKAGTIKWNKTIGYSNKSFASPIKAYNGFLFTGESIKEDNKIVIQKMDASGKVIWQTKMDSLHDVNAIYAEGDIVNALVSFKGSEKVSNGDGSFSYHNWPVYFFVELDIATGKKISEEYQRMGNYLSKLGFSNPLINSGSSYYLNNADSAAFFNVATQTSATIVSEKMSKENSILKLTAATESNHYLTLLSQSKNKKVYTVISDFYGKKKKYQSELPVKYVRSFNRCFICKNEGDSVLTIIHDGENIDICYTDIEGKSSLYKSVENTKSPVVAVTVLPGKICLVQVEGRNKPGQIGKVKLSYY